MKAPVYSAAWLVWALVLLAAEFAAPHEIRDLTYLYALAFFAVLEGIAVIRRDEGDTLSEQVWAFYGGLPARIPLVLGVVGWIGIRLYEMGHHTVALPHGELARLVLVLGVAGWLVPHFLGRGRWG